MAHDDAADVVFVFDRDARLEAEHLCVPVVTPHHVRHRQPYVVQAIEVRKPYLGIAHFRISTKDDVIGLRG
jgi:hypothetical protein